MIQDILTASIEIAFIGSIALFAVQFISGFSEKGAPASGTECNELDERLTEIYNSIPENDDFLSEIQEAQELQPQPVIVDQVVPFVRPVKSATVADFLKTQSIRQLKSISRLCRLPRYSSNTQSQLIERLLSEVDAARLQEVIAG